MSRRSNGSDRRKLHLKRETLRRLSARDLGQVAGGSSLTTEVCADSDACAESVHCTLDCTGGYGTGSHYC